MRESGRESRLAIHSRKNQRPQRTTAQVARADRPRERYPSDVSDTQWRQIESLLPPEPRRGRRRGTDLRDVVDAVNYRWTTGCPWRMLPHDFPPWATVYSYFREWRRDGTLQRIRNVLLRRSVCRGALPADGRQRSRRRSSGSVSGSRS